MAENVVNVQILSSIKGKDKMGMRIKKTEMTHKMNNQEQMKKVLMSLEEDKN